MIFAASANATTNPMLNAQLYLTGTSLAGVANNTQITSWTNSGKAGATYNASTASSGPRKVQYAGFPVLYFDNYTYISLALANAVNLTSGSLFMVGYDLGSSRLIALGGAGGAGMCFFGFSGSPSSFLLRDTSDSGLTENSLTNVTGLKVVGIVKNGASSLKLYDNSTTPVSKSALAGTFTFSLIGRRDSWGGQNSYGYLADVAYFDSVLSDADAGKVMAYLKQKYSIA